MSRGLYGQKYSGYWNGNVDFFNTATYIGIESTFASIDFPQSSVEDNFSWKWYGFITPSVSGTYTFGVTSDNRSKVYIDGTEITTADYLDGTVTGTYVLNSGQRYLIQIYYGEGAGGERIIFYWSGGSQTSLTTDLTTNILQFYPNNLLPINNNLVGWYKGEAWNGTSWSDLSGNGNHCTDIRGTINKAGNYIYGGTGDGIRFPTAILPSTYTLFHVTRYNGSTKRRIFDGTAGNWLSGFHNSKAGVAYHGYWLTESSSTNFPLDQILISSDQRNLYRGNGVDLKIGSGTSQSQRIGINYGSTSEYSDWAVWEVIVYNRELSLDEIETVEGYLFKTYYTYTNPVVPRGVNYFNPRDIVFYKKQGKYAFINQMTANTTIMEGLGEVVASASSEYNPDWQAWEAFNGTFGDEGWHSGSPYDYNSSTGVYQGSRELAGYSGEWLKIQFPIPLFLNYSVLYARSTLEKRLVKTGYLLASNDNINWSEIQYINRTSQTTSFVLLDKYVQRPFQYYAIVVSSIFSDTSTQISEWYMDVKIPKFQVSGTSNTNYFLLMDTNNWYTLFNRRLDYGGFPVTQINNNPVELQLQNYTIGNSNSLWYEHRIQDYPSFTVYFEYRFARANADGTSFKVGSRGIYMGGENNVRDAFNFDLQIYTGGGRSRTVYIWDNNGVNLLNGTSNTLVDNNWYPFMITYTRGTQGTWKVYNNGTLILNYDDDDNETWLKYSGPYFGFGSRTGGAYMDSWIRNFYINIENPILFTTYDGSSPEKAAYSARRLVEDHPDLDDGVYWINLPVVGPTQVYCILNTDCAGGGWMLAMKGTRGTTFNFDSNYWTTTNTLNPSETNRNDGDAKFDTFNYFQTYDWLAIFPDFTPPDFTPGGDVSGGYGGWTWVEGSAVGKKSVREFYASPTQITKLSNGVDYPLTNPTPTASSKFNSSIWSSQSGFQWYGINYTTYSQKSVRWGFAWNNEANQASNDVTGGIGLKYARYSAGNAFNCCNEGAAVYKSMRFEWYVR